MKVPRAALSFAEIVQRALPIDEEMDRLAEQALRQRMAGNPFRKLTTGYTLAVGATVDGPTDPANCMTCGATMNAAREDVPLAAGLPEATLVNCRVHRCACGYYEVAIPAIDRMLDVLDALAAENPIDPIRVEYIGRDWVRR